MSPSINDKQPRQQQLVSLLPLQLAQSWPLPGLPNHPTLDPLPRKALKVLEKTTFINYTYPRIGWKSTLKEHATQKSSNQNGPKKSQE